MAYATVSDLEARWRALSTSESDVAQTLLDDASLKINAVANVDARISDGTLNLGVAKIVVCGMVKRAMQTSYLAGVSQASETAGPFSRSQTFSNPTGDLYLSKEEKRLLGLVGQRAFSIEVGA